ncbi:glucose-6-phosphate isomerase, putative [Medicago truncatula]|uniref:Glucose-6-phosphate isomerase, putative n=1 Tax=Medicago truncatula TaxID=3880 RepID=A0A072VF20_MEDTR|nr:glucose-6-phosphate isomerase, putative [Medicago truncatula]
MDLSVVQSTNHQSDLHALWRCYVDWLYQHKEIGLYLDAELKAMEELEKGAIANPGERRMVVIANPDFSIFFRCSI